jgi:hypothetical protein
MIDLWREIDAGTIAVTPNPAPLEDMGRIWLQPDEQGRRTVPVP